MNILFLLTCAFALLSEGCLSFKIIKTGQFTQSMILKIHNAKRRLHGVPPLAYSDKLEKDAAACAYRMFNENLDPKNHPCNPKSLKEGENIGVLSGDKTSDDDMKLIERMWYEEGKLIDFNARHWFMGALKQKSQIGHFTQEVWKDTKQVGCAWGESSGKTIMVCRYYPQGNYFYPAPFRNNVLPAECSDEKNEAYCNAFKAYCSTAQIAKDCKKTCQQC